MVVIGDVHGCYKTLIALLDKLPKDEKIVFTGDLIDRGPMSKEVVQLVMDNNFPTVTGNHEDMMVGESKYRYDWGYNGSSQTLDSYGMKYSVRFSDPSHMDPIEDQDPANLKVFMKHKEWMSNLPVYLLFDDVVNDSGEKLLVSHSSAAKVWKWSEERRKEMEHHFRDHIIWGRDYNPQHVKGIFNVIGHTPVKEPAIRGGVAFIDTGAVFKKKLTALRFPQMEIFQQEFID